MIWGYCAKDFEKVWRCRSLFKSTESTDILVGYLCDASAKHVQLHDRDTYSGPMCEETYLL